MSKNRITAENILSSMVFGMMHSLVSEMPRAEDMDDPIDLVDDIPDMLVEMRAAAIRHIAPEMARRIIEENEVPPIKGRVRFEVYDAELDRTVAVEEVDFDATLALEAVFDAKFDDEDWKYENVPDDALEIDFDLEDEIVRQAMDFGLLPMWRHGFYLLNLEGYDSWRDFRAAEIAKETKHGQG